MHLAYIYAPQFSHRFRALVYVPDLLRTDTDFELVAISTQCMSTAFMHYVHAGAAQTHQPHHALLWGHNCTHGTALLLLYFEHLMLFTVFLLPLMHIP